MTNKIPSETQPESQDRFAGLTGGFPRIERQAAHESLFNHTTGFPGVMISLQDARRLTDQGKDATTYLGKDYQIITTTTMDDDDLRELNWEDERDIVTEFNPDYHIPTDYPVYYGDPVAVREQHIKECLTGAAWMSEELRDSRTTVLPIFRATTPGEREMCYRFYEKLSVRHCVIYGVQYFTSGPGFSKLLEDVREIVSEAPWLRILLIGAFAPHQLRQLPPQVVAASGLQKWLRYTDLRDSPLNYSVEKARELSEKVDQALAAGQTPLGMWQQVSRGEVA